MNYTVHDIVIRSSSKVVDSAWFFMNARVRRCQGVYIVGGPRVEAPYLENLRFLQYSYP
eukprot:SAG31_NODE_17248_length_678_cov_0.753022_1_plen_58_part_10